VTGCADGSVRVFDIKSGLLKISLQGHSGSVDHVVFDGSVIVSVGTDK
jgi:WD40 repeat protein